jgi:hypothetical protein
VNEIAYRSRGLVYLTPDFAQYALRTSPPDDVLAAELANGPDDRLGLTLEGITEQELLTNLRFYRDKAEQHRLHGS